MHQIEEISPEMERHQTEENPLQVSRGMRVNVMTRGWSAGAECAGQSRLSATLANISREMKWERWRRVRHK